MTDSDVVRWFSGIGVADLPIAGGKGANLGELAHADLPVPPGFVITTPAYVRFVDHNQLQSAVMEATAGHTPTQQEALSTQIRSRFVQGTIPPDLAAEITRSYLRLIQDHAPAVAVRSSATAEDLPDASFAGQQETYLNVHGGEALLDAVKACWASLWTERAIAYRQRQRIGPDAVKMAVVVQVMAPANVSGVLFTANPNSGDRDEIIVNASYGLGEAIVSGAVTPDSFVLDRQSGAVKETRLGSKEVMIVPADGESATETQTVVDALRTEPALSPSLLGELAALGLRVEAHFGGVPQDIEWSLADGQIWLLQARPITNLPPAPLKDVRWEPPRPNSIWMRRQVVEHMPEPLSPLFAELYLEEGLSKSFDEMALFMGKLADTELNVWDFVEPPFAITVNGYAYTIGSFQLRRELIPKFLGFYVQVLPKMIQHMVPYWRDNGLPTYLSTIEKWKSVDFNAAADEKLLQGMHDLAVADAVYWFAAAVPLGLARVTDALLDSFLKEDVAGRLGADQPRPTSGSYLRGFPSKTLDAQMEIEQIARQIRASAELARRVEDAPAQQLLAVLSAAPEGRPILDAIHGHLARYGHQIYSLDFVVPTQAEEPLPVLLSIKGALAHPAQDALAQQARLSAEREALIQRTNRVLGPLSGWFFRLFLGWAQRFSPYREEALFYVGAGWPVLRRLALELGRRLHAAGSLHSADHVFYLLTPELTAVSHAREDGVARADLADLARKRVQLREARKRLNPPLSVPADAQLKFGPIRLKMFEPPAPPTVDGPMLAGVAVSPGTVTAAASVILSPSDFDKMTPDTILVCPTTTPAWTPLFSQARGLVTDIGGALAHGSIVAREYGIPAVMGTGIATQRIRSGQRIHIDGDRGTVTLLDEVATGEQPQIPEPQKKSPLGRILAVGTLIGLVLWLISRRKRGN
ncbi:phosphoenolpyruvate synthase [bacterium]|nr:phosphoenolpyruvate synthase [bacterium]